MATSVTSSGLKAAADKVILASRPVVETLKLFSTSFTLEPSKKGAGVVVQVLNAVAGDFGSSNGYTKSSGTIKPATVILDQHKKASYTIGDTDALENELDPIWGSLAPSAGKAVAKAAVTHAMSILDYNHAKAVVQSGATTLADFTALRAVAEAQGLDPEDCVLILRPAQYAALLAVLPASVIGNGAAITAANIGSFVGFKAVIDAPNATTTSGSGETKGFGFIVPTGALAIAARVRQPLKQGGNLLESGTIQDEETGFPFGTRVVVDADQGETTWNVDTIFGAALTYDASTNPNAPRYVQLKTA